MIDLNRILKTEYEKRRDKPYIFEKINGRFEGKTFGRLMEDVHAFARLLTDKGLFGEPVAIIGKNSYAFLVADLAVTAYTGVSVMLSPEMNEETVLALLAHTGAKALVFADEMQALADSLAAKHPLLCLKNSEITSLPAPKSLFDLPEKDETTCAKIVFSSGTTGPAKGIMLSLKNIFAGYPELKKRVPLGEADTDYLFLPLHHTYAGVYNFYYSLIGGYSLYLSSSPAAIAGELLEVNPTIFCAVPLVYQRLLNAYGSKVTSAFGTKIKYLFTGGAACPAEIIDALSCFPLIRSYGLSETAASFSISYYGDNDDSCGNVFESIDARVIDADENGVGEIICKGDTVFLGYLDPALTARAFDENGYFHTGDLGVIKDGKVYIKGRKKKILVGGNGKNIDVGELVSLLTSIDGNIRAARLFLNGDRLNAALYVADSKKDVAASVEAFNARVPRYERIDRYEVIADTTASRLK